ncbi:MAG: prepilin-type N-terminal cleavage/methylation domain-containing protein [Vulcanimicrobiota bacterium]
MKRRAFTLIEMTVAAALLALVLIATLRSLSLNHRAVSSDRNRTNALCIGHAVLESVRSLPFGTDVKSFQGPVDWPSEQLDGHTVQNHYEVKEIVCQPSSNLDFQNVTVTVVWGGGKSVEVSGWWSR